MARQTSIESYQSAVDNINEKDYLEVLNKETKTLGDNLESIAKSVGNKMGSAIGSYAKKVYGIGPKLIGGPIFGNLLPLDTITNKIAETEGNIVGKTFGTVYGTAFKAAGDTITSGFHLVSKVTPFSFLSSYERQRKRVEEIAEQIKKMQVECDNLTFMIASTAQRDLENSISDLEKAKATIKTQKLESGAQDKIKIIVNEIDAEIDNLRKLISINDQFLEKLKKLGTGQVH